MNGKGGSSLGTFLFSIPLAAIPLMAIFGIPQFAPLVASPDRGDGYERTRDNRPFDEDRHHDDRSYRRKAADALRSRGYETSVIADADSSAFPEDQGPLVQQRDERFGEPGDRHGASPSEFASDDAPPFRTDDRRMVQPIGELSDAPAAVESPAESRPAAGMTWRSAAERLQDLGISSYHLEPGSELGSFLFVCSFCPEASPNVTMRFEAESAEPLDAVDDVLAQIDRWQQQQAH